MTQSQMRSTRGQPSPWARGDEEGKNRSGPVSRVLFPPLSRRAANIRLGPWLPRGLISEQPERSGRAILVPRTAGTRSYWLLLQVGFTVPPESPRTRCALTAPFHPYPPLAGRAVCFLWHFPSSHLDWPLASTLPCGARTFLPPPVPAVAGVHPGRSGGYLLQQVRGGGHSPSLLTGENQLEEEAHAGLGVEWSAGREVQILAPLEGALPRPERVPAGQLSGPVSSGSRETLANCASRHSVFSRFWSPSVTSNQEPR